MGAGQTSQNWDPPKETLVPYYAQFPIRVLLRRQVCDVGDVEPGSLHEAVKARLFQVARKLRLQPSPEYPIERASGRRGKVDMVFITSKRKLPMFAFEIDGTVRWNSIEKLGVFPDYTAKWIISTSRNLRLVKYRWKERLADREDIHTFSVHLEADGLGDLHK